MIIDDELNELNRTLVLMCTDANAAMSNLLKHLETGAEAERRAVEIEESIKSRKSDAEARCVRLLVLRQPVARDLRKVKAALGVIVDLMRVAEQARHITELSPHFDGYTLPVEMCRIAANMVRRACESYLSADTDVAAEVARADDGVDEMYARIRRELTDVLRNRTADGDDWVLDCLLTAKYLERISDHAVKIAGAVHDL